jgi:hypothetical protein
MGYGLWLTYGLWYAFPRPPSWWTARAMGYKELWGIWGMGYEEFDCTFASVVGRGMGRTRRSANFPPLIIDLGGHRRAHWQCRRKQ